MVGDFAALVLLATFFQYLGKPSCVENESKLDMVKVCRSKPYALKYYLAILRSLGRV
jgi:hypothetical protein